MARKPKPWYRKDRRSWYVTIDGKRHDLGPDKKAAHEKFHQLMSEPHRRVVDTESVVAIVDAFLDWCHNHRASDTYEWYRYRLQRFADTYPDLLTRDLRPYHVQQWLDQLEGLSRGTKRNHGRAIKRAMHWALQQGYIEHDPIAHVRLPKGGKRETVVNQAEFDEMLELIPDRCFRDLLLVTWETGCRPQESLRVEARHVDLTNSRWVFPETEGKGGTIRIVYLTDQALAITKRLVLQHPEGTLFRNSAGRPWTTDAVNNVFVRLQIRLGQAVMQQRDLNVDESEVLAFIATLSRQYTVDGVRVEKSRKCLLSEARRKLKNRLACQLGRKYSLYALRHSWATHALERGLDALTVAVLMGHRDPSTLAKVYQHLGHNPRYLLEQAKKAAG